MVHVYMGECVCIILCMFVYMHVCVACTEKN